VGGDLRGEELSSFYRDIARLAESVAGEARFTTMEDWLSNVVIGDRRSHVELTGEIRYRPGVGNTLDFRLALAQTYLRPMIDQLGRAVSEFPEIDGLGGQLGDAADPPAPGCGSGAFGVSTASRESEHEVSRRNQKRS
jgi:hypothetical protein